MIAPRSLESYLHEQIPLSAAMQVSVLSVTADAVMLSAPLAPNINHKRTAFGGSIATLGILAAWSLLHVRLLEEGLPCEVVIQSSHVDYVKPITGAFAASSSLADASGWPRFLQSLVRRRIARVEVRSQLSSEGVDAGCFHGRFVAFLQKA